MVNILLEGYRIDMPWLYNELKKYISKGKKVTVFALSFRSSEVFDKESWQKNYGKGSRIYNGIVNGLSSYGISEEDIEFINYYEDDSKTAAQKLQKADIIYFTSGLPDKMIERIKELGIYEPLCNFEKTVIGYSAGALIQLSEYHLSPDKDYPEFGYKNGLPYIDDFYLESHYQGTDIQNAAIRKVLAERDKTVYATHLMRGAIISDNKKIKLLGEVTQYDYKKEKIPCQ